MPDKPDDRPLVLGALVLIVLALFFYSLLPVLSPLVLFLALLVLMTPYAGTNFHILVVSTTAVLVFLWLLKATGALLAPFVLAFVLAYILDPVVDRLEAGRLPRWLAIILLILPVIGALVLVVFVGLPALANQVEVLIARAPAALEELVEWVEGLRTGILGIDLPLIREDALVERLRVTSPDDLVTFLEEQRAEIGRRAWQAVLGVGRGLGALLTVLGYVVLTPVLTYYLLRDYDAIIGRISDYVPRRRTDRWTRFAREYDTLLSRYLRGQLLAAATVGVLTWLGLWVLGFPYPGLVGAVAGVFNVVPYLGLAVSLVPALIIALLSGSVLASLIKVAIVFAAVQALDGTVIGPRIVGGSVGLHPVLVILSLAVGGYFFGFAGLLLAIPAALLVKMLAGAGLERYRKSAVFLGLESQGTE